MTNKVEGKVVLLTGAAKGIGACSARMLADAGAHLVLTDIDSSSGESLANELNRADNEVIFMRHDVSLEDDWIRVVERIDQHFSGLDVLINNAGIALIKPIEQTTLAEWRKISRVNVDGVFLGMKHCLSVMKDRAKSSIAGGAMVNLSSVAGMVGVPSALAYTMSKAAIRHMTKSAAMEFAELGYNIRVNSVHPGLIKTDMADRIYQSWADSGALGTHDVDETEKAMIAMHPLGRHGQPEDIAKGILYLASDDSAYMTGSELVIDGGFIAR